MIRELEPGETHRAAVAMLELRPHLGDADAFVRRVDDVQRPEGYRLVASFDDDDAEDAAGVAGFRVVHLLSWGHATYVDDLSTRAASRGRGHAGALLDWLVDEAVRLGCDQLHLDSGVLPERADAHRLYYNKRLQVRSLHFARELPATPPSPRPGG
jgi:GNAT superfamily N-acetyltransferase